MDLMVFFVDLESLSGIRGLHGTPFPAHLPGWSGKRGSLLEIGDINFRFLVQF